METAELDELLKDVEAYAESHNGKIYAPIDHPAFAHVPSQHGPERFDPIRATLPDDVSTALDIGSHWGYFAHRLEGLGLTVTAAENAKFYLPYLHGIRSLYGDMFEIVEDSILELPGKIEYDVVLALNIFHHFIKTEKVHEQFADFLSRLSCEVMYFQSHNVREGQMAGAYRNYSPDEFCAFIVDHVPTLTSVEQIADFRSRPMFKVSAG